MTTTIVIINIIIIIVIIIIIIVIIHQCGILLSGSCSATVLVAAVPLVI